MSLDGELNYCVPDVASDEPPALHAATNHRCSLQHVALAPAEPQGDACLALLQIFRHPPEMRPTTSQALWVT